MAVAATVSLVAAGCDSSPFAASINGQVVKQTVLDAELASRSANSVYIDSIDANGASSGLKVQGASSGTYTTAWTAQVLNDLVDATAVHQHLVRTHDLPTPAVLDAARAVSAAANAQNLVWYRFPPSLRDAFVQRFADQAMLYPSTGVSPSYVSRVFSGYGGSLFTSLCVRTVNVSVPGAHGIDMAASRARAVSIQKAIDAGSAGSTGSVTCYDARTFAGLSLGLITTLLALPAHKAAVPERTPYGYQVIAVASRALVPIGPALLRVLSAANASAAGTQRVEAVIAAAHVQVNPAYGTWARTRAAGYRVVPPSTARFAKAS